MNTDGRTVLRTDKKTNEKDIMADTKENTNAKITSGRAKDLIEGLIGRDVMIVFKSKNKLKGRLEAVSMYELMLTTSQRPVLAMKHAVDYIEMIDTTS